MNFQGMGCRMFCGEVSPRVPIVEPSEGVCLQGTE